jgi:hypothetical protein
VPVTAGATVFTGGEVIAAVAADVAEALPLALTAVTVQVIVASISAVTVT